MGPLRADTCGRLHSGEIGLGMKEKLWSLLRTESRHKVSPDAGTVPHRRFSQIFVPKLDKLVLSIEERRFQGEIAVTTFQVKVELPDPLAAEAQAAGLLAPEQLERMLREALRAKRVEKLAAAREVLAANPLPPMTPEEIQAEIDAYRAEVRRAAGT